MLYQNTIIYFQNDLLIGSVEDQFFLVCTSSPFPVSCGRQHQAILLECIERKFPTVCLGALTLTGIIAVPKNDVNFCVSSRYFGHIFSSIKKVVCGQCCRLPFHLFWDIIKHLSNIIYHGEFNFTHTGVVFGHPKAFVDLTLCDDHFWNTSILCIIVSENARYNVGINM